MPTIPLSDPKDATGKTREILDAILRREAKIFGASSVSNIWRAMGHVPEYLEANWQRSRAIMQSGDLPALVKESVAVAVSIVNVCHY